MATAATPLRSAAAALDQYGRYVRSVRTGGADERPMRLEAAACLQLLVGRDGGVERVGGSPVFGVQDIEHGRSRPAPERERLVNELLALLDEPLLDLGLDGLGVLFLLLGEQLLAILLLIGVLQA